jgi:hypothetical protein
MRRGSAVGGSSLMSSAWRATGVVIPVASVKVTVMWSLLTAWVDAADELMTNNVATSNARLIEPSSIPGQAEVNGSAPPLLQARRTGHRRPRHHSQSFQ